ncbi:hypothetical protein Tco_1202307 [Tanacetum coccineum]
MAARGGRNNLVARRVIDDLIDISGERSPLKYLKIFIEQQITDHRRFIARMRDEIRTSMNLISQLNALIAKLEASGDYEEVFNLVMELLDDRCHIPPRRKREARRERESSQHIGVYIEELKHA